MGGAFPVLLWPWVGLCEEAAPTTLGKGLVKLFGIPSLRNLRASNTCSTFGLKVRVLDGLRHLEGAVERAAEAIRKPQGGYCTVKVPTMPSRSWGLQM
jgi:hypothetical protein